MCVLAAEIMIDVFFQNVSVKANGFVVFVVHVYSIQGWRNIYLMVAVPLTRLTTWTEVAM